MNRLAALTTGRTFLPLFVIYPILAIGFLSAYPSDSEAKHNQKQKATADSRFGILPDGDQFTNDSRSDSFNLRDRRNKHDQRRHFGKFNSQGYQGKRVPQGYHGKRVRQGYQGKRVGQGYRVDGYSRRRSAQLRWRRSSPPPNRDPYARRSSTVWKRSPSAKSRTKSLSPSSFGAVTEPNFNGSLITPNFGSAATNKHSNPSGSYGNIFGATRKKPSKRSSSYSPFKSYNSNPYGNSKENPHMGDAGTFSETPAWPNYSLIDPGWPENN